MTNFKHVWLTKLGGVLPIHCSWCSRKATHLLTRIDKDDNKYEKYVCDSHASEWDKYRQGEQMELEIE
jgi:hypothetical protein